MCSYLFLHTADQNISCWVAKVSALVTVGFYFDDEPTVNSQDELAVDTSGSHNLRRRSNG